MKFYLIFGGVVVVIGLIVLGFIYVKNTEQQIKHLQLEKQAQEITIKTINHTLQKQQKIINENKKLQEKYKQLELTQQERRERQRKLLKEAGKIEEKQEIFENIL